MSDHASSAGRHALPGSLGEHQLQGRHDTAKRARGFYNHQVLDHVNEHMRAFIGRMEMAFIATADALGEADSSFRAGPPGFIAVLDDRTLAYPEYRGNGVMASLGNIVENGHIGILFVDFCGDAIGLHVNGRAAVVENDALRSRGSLPAGVDEALAEPGGRSPERWVLVDVIEAYIHCSKHIPQLMKRSDALPEWGTDDVVKKGGDYFKAKVSRRTGPVPTPVPAPSASPLPAPEAPAPAAIPRPRQPVMRRTWTPVRKGVGPAS